MTFLPHFGKNGKLLSLLPKSQRDVFIKLHRFSQFFHMGMNVF